MFAPLNPTIVTEEIVGMVFPSQLASIRITDDSVTPEYIQFYLSQEHILKRLISQDTGIEQRAIKISRLSNVEIAIPPLEIQKKICKIVYIYNTQVELRKQLAEQEEMLTKAIIHKMIYGK
ncbi:restriction endonuclease subunit S [Clostridium botulinum]|nr:restriction endonuclease subunit S [Clostridium botulinum]